MCDMTFEFNNSLSKNTTTSCNMLHYSFKLNKVLYKKYIVLCKRKAKIIFKIQQMMLFQ